MRHPAHEMDYDRLEAGLAKAVADGHVYESQDGDLSLFCYTKGAVYDQAWTEFVLLARGLVLDRAARRIAATPFPKFHNLGEGGREAPPGPFEAYEKLDGSLIIAFFHQGRWRTATKGSFSSDQAVAAARLLPFERMDAGLTHLFELIGPSNKIVVRYPKDECRLLGAYDASGRELERAELEALDLGGMKLARAVACSSVAELVLKAKTLPADQEGWVLRWPGYRLKVKGEDYKRLHAAISRLSPITVWEAIAAGGEEAMRRELPEEFWEDFDSMRAILDAKISALRDAVAAEAAKWAGVDDKTLGLSLKTIPEPQRGFLFAFRKGQIDEGRTRQALLRQVRPTGNLLEGYVPSGALLAAGDDDA